MASEHSRRGSTADRRRPGYVEAVLLTLACAAIVAPRGATEVNYALQVENHGRHPVTIVVDSFVAWQDGEPALHEEFDDAAGWAVEAAPMQTNCNETPDFCTFRNAVDDEVSEGSLHIEVPPAEYRAVFPCDLTDACSHPIRGGEVVRVEVDGFLPGNARARVTIDFLADRYANDVAATFNGEWANGNGDDAVILAP